MAKKWTTNQNTKPLFCELINLLFGGILAAVDRRHGRCRGQRGLKRTLYFAYESRDTLKSFLFVTVETITKLNLEQSYKFVIEINNELPVVVHVLQITQNLVISRSCFAEDGRENGTKNYNVRAQSFNFCSLNLLFAVVVFKTFLIVTTISCLYFDVNIREICRKKN